MNRQTQHSDKFSSEAEKIEKGGAFRLGTEEGWIQGPLWMQDRGFTETRRVKQRCHKHS